MEKLLTPAETAEQLRISPATLRWWRQTGRGPAVIQIGPATFRYSQETINNYVHEHIVKKQSTLKN